MKVLMTTDTVGGVWDYALELARMLAPHGVEVALATMGAPLSSAQEEETRALAGLTVYPSRYRLEWMDDPWPDVAEAGEWLLRLERCLRPDVIHVNGYTHGALPWQAPALVVGHSCVLSWWEAVKGEPAPPRWDRYRQEVARGLRAASRVVAPTCWMRDALEKHYGPFAASQVIANGRDPARFPPAPKEPFLLAAGRLWDEAKNLAALERVAGRLPWPVYVAGEAQHPDGGRVATCRVRALGRLAPPALAGWLSRAAIYVLPARYEPFGLSVLEAALSGCALVVGDIPSLREVWGDAALFVPPEDTAALEAALCGLIADGAWREEMAARASLRARRYSAERMGAAYLSLYRDMVRTGRSREQERPCVS